MIEIAENKFGQIFNEKAFEAKLRERFSPSEQTRVYDQKPIIKKLVSEMKKKAGRD